MNNIEQTLSIIKPDAVERNLIENIKSIFRKNKRKIFRKWVNYKKPKKNTNHKRRSRRVLQSSSNKAFLW